MRLVLVLAIALVGFPLASGLAAHDRARAPMSPPQAAAPRPKAPPRPPRVTVIGDSVADELAYVSSARVLLRRGVRLRLQLAPCRRLVEPSCTVAGVQPPTALELIRSLGDALGQVAVVSVGYNDDAYLYRRDVVQVLAALNAAGVERVLWLNLRTARHPYVAMNDELRKIADDEPQLTVVDWNRYSRSHRSWFDSDGLHLTPAGATGLARLLHRALVGAPVASRPSRT